jgi:hypothetical protein
MEIFLLSFFSFFYPYITTPTKKSTLLILFLIILLINVRRNYAQPDSNIERQLMPRPVAVASGPTDWNEALDIISFGSPEQVDDIA